MSKMKINHNYFALSKKLDIVKSSYKQGNIVPHLVDRIKWHVFPRLRLVPRFPTHIDIEASSECNLLCPMCKSTNIRKAGIKFGESMEWGLYTKLIDECAKNSLYSIKLSWRGEPLMHSRIEDLVQYAKDKGIKDVAFLTNGVKLYPWRSAWLIDAGLDWISFSIDGYGETYEKIRYPAKFGSVYSNIANMRYYINKVNSKCQIRVQSIQSAIEGREAYFRQLWEGIAHKVYVIPDQVRTLNEEDYKHDTEYVCPNPWQRMVIASDGTVPLCITDYCLDHVIGNTNTQTIKEIWQGKEFKRQREIQASGKRLTNKPCRICGTGALMKDGKYV